jgi:hypothetical protein
MVGDAGMQTTFQRTHIRSLPGESAARALTVKVSGNNNREANDEAIQPAVIAGQNKRGAATHDGCSTARSGCSETIVSSDTPADDAPAVQRFTSA